MFAAPVFLRIFRIEFRLFAESQQYFVGFRWYVHGFLSSFRPKLQMQDPRVGRTKRLVAEAGVPGWPRNELGYIIGEHGFVSIAQKHTKTMHMYLLYV